VHPQVHQYFLRLGARVEKIETDGYCGTDAGATWQASTSGTAAPSGADAPVEEVKLGDAPARGPANAPVTVVVFSDFQCPFCVRAEGTIAELEKQYAGKLRVLYKSRPLPMHQHTRLAAKAAIDAGHNGYTVTQGIPELLDAVLGYLPASTSTETKTVEIEDADDADAWSPL